MVGFYPAQLNRMSADRYRARFAVGRGSETDQDEDTHGQVVQYGQSCQVNP